MVEGSTFRVSTGTLAHQQTERPLMHDPDVTLFPAVEPFDSGMLRTGGGHDAYWERCGHPAGLSALVPHGGRGAGHSPLDAPMTAALVEAAGYFVEHGGFSSWGARL